MWPYNESEAEWLEHEFPDPETISPEMIRRYISDGQRLRSQVMAAHVAALIQAIGSGARTVIRGVAHLFGAGADARPPAGSLSHHE